MIPATLSHKRIHFSRLLRDPATRQIATYTFTNFLGKAASFLLLFVFTNPAYISPAENGLLSLFSTGLLFLMPFLSMGLLHSSSTDFFKLDKSQFQTQFTTGFVMAFGVMLLSTCLMLMFSPELYNAYQYPLLFCWLIPVITFLSFCNEQLLSLLRNSHKSSVFFRVNTLKIALELGLSFLLVVGLAWRWEGRVAGITAAYLMIGCFSLWYFIRHGYLSGKISLKVFRQEMLYAVPVVVMQISIFCMNASDKFFLAALSSDNAVVGIYSIASIFASIILALSMSLIQYVFPKIYAELSMEKPRYEIISKTFRLYLIVMLTGSLLAALLTSPAYHYFIHPRYHEALSYVYVLLAANFVWTIVYFFYSFLLYFKEKKRILALSLATICLAVVSNYLMIRSFSASGAAYSSLIIYIIALILVLYATKKYWRNFILSQCDAK